MKNKRWKSDACGFTLLETSIALIFLAIVTVGIAPVMFYAINYNSAAAIRAGALGVAQKKLEQIRATSFTDLASSTETISVGDQTTALQTYTVETTITDVSTTLKTISIRITPIARSTDGGQYAGEQGWKYGQVTVYTNRTSLGAGPYLG
jgi:type II secretory pathway pseudopilin PulG